MANWLEIYRSGQWKDGLEVPTSNISLGKHITWRSPVWGTRRGVVVLTDSNGWVLVEGVTDLTWVHPQHFRENEVLK